MTVQNFQNIAWTDLKYEKWRNLKFSMKDREKKGTIFSTPKKDP